MAWTIIVLINLRFIKNIFGQNTLYVYLHCNGSDVQNLEIAYIYCCFARFARGKGTKGQNLPLIT